MASARSTADNDFHAFVRKELTDIRRMVETNSVQVKTLAKAIGPLVKMLGNSGSVGLN